MNRNDLFTRDKYVLLDGGMGTMLQARGLKLGARPELLSITEPEMLTGIHREYVQAGADIVYANTFGASAKKLEGSGYSVAQVISASLACARRAVQGTGALVALDVGPLGELLEPAGTLKFEDAYRCFQEIVIAGAQADVIVVETMTDLYEVKAAILAAKENSTLPVMVSMSFEQNGRSFTGCTVESFAATAVGLGADAVGINCSLGPVEILPLAQRLCQSVPKNFPVFVKPNAGLPRADGSGYDITPEMFCDAMAQYLPLGICMLGGCCGTTPQYIGYLAQITRGKAPQDTKPLQRSLLCTPVKTVDVCDVTVVGERINPTGKKRFQQALRERDMDYILAQAVDQESRGAQVLDVNVGLPDIDEPSLMEQTVKALQSVVDLPLQLDSSNPAALERGLRAYNGKPIVNSVNGEESVLRNILPLCKKYGAAVVGLTLDQSGIPPKAEGRFAIAKRITEAALAAGIPREDIYIDCLTLTASAQQEAVVETLKAIRMCKQQLGVRTVLGVSNISFGLPCRTYLNTAFFTLAMYEGLDLAIINPSSSEMMAARAAFRVLTNRDAKSMDYVNAYAGMTTVSTLQAAGAAAPAVQAAAGGSLGAAIEKGLKSEAKAAAAEMLKTMQPLEVVDGHLIPALDRVGEGFEAGKVFLPQLLQSAAAAQSAFEAVKDAIAAEGSASESKGKIVLATVKGDIHDIGKNIVKVILENYGFTVLDLGRDVPPEAVVQAVRESGAPLVGLSALMTTTVKSMEETIRALHESGLACKVMVGGAVLTPEYAEMIGADYYAKDAKRSADIAKKLFGVN